MEELRNFISQIITSRPENCMKIYFSRRIGHQYITHQPVASNEVQYGIIDTMFPFVTEQIDSHNIVEYNPVGVLDEEIEKIEVEKVPMWINFMNSIEEDLNQEMSSLKIENIGFYCVAITYNGKTLYLFRQFQKLKKLRQGLFTRIVENELKRIESDFLGIDEFTDMIVFENDLLLLNHISFERIFDYRDEFLKKTNEALGEILSQNVIENIEQFAYDCRSDVRIMKRFTNIMTQERLPLFFKNYERVPLIVKELGLDIDFDEDGKLIYRERSQLFHIINLLSDAYFKSLIAQRPGVAKLEGDI